MPDRAWLQLGRVGLVVALGFLLSACYGLEAPAGDSATDAAPAASSGDVKYPADNMWAFLSSTPGLERSYEDLAAAVTGSDAVVVGRFVGLERGSAFAVPGEVPGWHAIAEIQLDQVLKGTPPLEAGSTIRVDFVLVVGGKDYPETTFANLTRSMPAGAALLFLDSWATYFSRAGGDIPEGFEALNSKELYRTIGGDGAIRIEQGLLSPPDYVDGWPQDLKGLAIDTVEAQIRSVVGARK